MMMIIVMMTSVQGGKTNTGALNCDDGSDDNVDDNDAQGCETNTAVWNYYDDDHDHQSL